MRSKISKEEGEDEVTLSPEEMNKELQSFNQAQKERKLKEAKANDMESKVHFYGETFHSPLVTIQCEVKKDIDLIKLKSARLTSARPIITTQMRMFNRNFAQPPQTAR